MQPCCTGDEGGPLGIGLQGRVPNRPELRGSRAQVVSVRGKGGPRARQVGARKTNASESLATCRKRRDVIETGLQSLARDEAWEQPAYCPGGDRHQGGVSLAQAPVRNVGTCRPDAKGEPQVVVP